MLFPDSTLTQAPAAGRSCPAARIVPNSQPSSSARHTSRPNWYERTLGAGPYQPTRLYSARSAALGSPTSNTAPWSVRPQVGFQSRSDGSTGRVHVSPAAPPRWWRCRSSSSASSPRRHALPHRHQPQAPRSARATGRLVNSDHFTAGRWRRRSAQPHAGPCRTRGRSCSSSWPCAPCA